MDSTQQLTQLDQQAKPLSPVMHFLGIDVSKDKFDVALIIKAPQSFETNIETLKPTKGKRPSKYKDNNDDRHKAKVFPNTPQGFTALRAWLQTNGVDSVHVCMEATGVYWEALATDLCEAGLHVSVVNPAQIALYARSILSRGKTDSQDARTIARFCERERPSLWVAAPLEQRQLLQVVRQRQHLEDCLLAEENRFKTAIDIVLPSITAVISALQEAIAKIDALIHTHIQSDSKLKDNQDLLLSIPGVGDKTAPWLLAYLGDGTKFGRGKQAAAYAGLTPKHWESGTSIKGPSHISKMGQTDLRRNLYMPALGVYGKHKKYPQFVERLKAAGKSPKVIIVAVMRKILTIAQAVLRDQKPFNPAFHAA